MRRGLIFGILCILLVTSALAIGVSPARSYIKYEPGEEHKVKLRILHDGTPARISLYAQGDLGPYVEFSKNLVIFEQGELAHEVWYSVTPPTNLDPGVHEADIVALQLPDVNANADKPKEAIVVATTAIASKLQVEVPYPGKYVRGKVHISEGLAGENIGFQIPVYNFGKVNADAVYARIEIYSATNELLGEVNTPTIALAAESEGTLRGNWIANVNAGRYLAKVTLFFDGEKVAYEKLFNVGHVNVRIRDITVDPFSLGEVAKFYINLENTWNEPIRNAYFDVVVLDTKGNTVDTFKSSPTNLQPNEEQTLNAFWDTQGMTEGRYDLKFVLRYAEKTTEKILQVLLTLNGIETELVGTGQVIASDESLLKRDSVLILLVLILIVMNVFILFKFVIRRGGQ